MNERHKEIYARLSKIGFPLVCAIALYLGYTRAQDRDRLYWETPSIPFQPFCDEGGNWGDIRPIRDVRMSRKFIREVVNAVGVYGGTMHLSYSVWRGSVLGPNPHPLLVTPKLFNDSSSMITITRRAVNAMHGLTVWHIKGQEPKEASLYCKDVEGKVKEF